jgi:hypothetical protein
VEACKYAAGAEHEKGVMGFESFTGQSGWELDISTLKNRTREPNCRETPFASFEF